MLVDPDSSNPLLNLDAAFLVVVIGDIELRSFLSSDEWSMVVLKSGNLNPWWLIFEALTSFPHCYFIFASSPYISLWFTFSIIKNSWTALLILSSSFRFLAYFLIKLWVSFIFKWALCFDERFDAFDIVLYQSYDFERNDLCWDYYN